MIAVMKALVGNLAAVESRDERVVVGRNDGVHERFIRRPLQ